MKAAFFVICIEPEQKMCEVVKEYTDTQRKHMWSSIYLGLTALMVLPAMIYTDQSNQEDERTIRSMVEQAISRLNKGDSTAVGDFWAQDADYVSVDGKLVTGRDQIRAFFQELAKSSAGSAQQTASVERIRFLTSEIAIVDGLWTVTGARDAAGKELPPIKGRGFEVVQKREGRWWFVATREMVIFKGN
jgi:uncharacterized protein (TIGR02246 family)